VLLDDLAAAFMLLTRLPVGWATHGARDLARTVWAFPIVGLVVGGLGGVAYWLAHGLGVPSFLGGCWAIATMLLATGGFHEDGLADTADGFGGGRTVARKLEIMRDSRIGSYGAIGLILSMLMRVGAVASLARPHAVAIALILAAMLARAGIILILILLRPARPDGMAAAMADIPRRSVWIGLGLAGIAPFICLPFSSALIVVVVAVCAALAVARMAHRQIGGHSGDVLGAGAMTVECVVLTALTSLLA
jgi:adenosylcobinamide-GDP ribazoletransferase